MHNSQMAIQGLCSFNVCIFNHISFFLEIGGFIGNQCGIITTEKIADTGTESVFLTITTPCPRPLHLHFRGCGC